MFAPSLILDTDSYKLSHRRQYPPGTQSVSCYIEARGGAWPEILFFGLQAWLKARLSQPVTLADIDEAEAFCDAHFGRSDVFDRAGWLHIVEAHGGRLPVSIEALPEGTIVGPHVPVLQIRNTDPDCFWLPGHLETALLRAVWYPSTVASLSLACHRLLATALERTADDLSALPFQLHDFGARGASSEAAAALGGAAHLLNFRGSDTLSGALLARRCYAEPMAGQSIPAAEHATVTAWGQARETDAYRAVIRGFAGEGRMLAFVVDSYDVWNALDHLVGEALHDEIRDCGARVVIRPDSGDPVRVLPEVVERLMRRFGARTNTRGFRLLPDYLRVIQGDGVTPQSLPAILGALEQRGLSTENCAFGMGGGLLQKLDRDTLGWAMKASEVVIDGTPRPIHKAPVDAPGKASRAGRWAVCGAPGALRPIPESEAAAGSNQLREVWRDGELRIDETFSRLRERVAAQRQAAALATESRTSL
jgi:Nicotinic acid phosphoribosyltransferase